MENIQNLQRGEPTVIASEPYCVVVAGECAETQVVRTEGLF